MNSLAAWSFVVPLIALAIPVVLALVALTSPKRALLGSSTAFGMAIFFALSAFLSRGTDIARGANAAVRVDLLTAVMLLLVGGIGSIVVRFSRTYLEGDPGLNRYLRWLLLTLSAVTTLVIANHLLVIALGWTATSVALHQLLTFYGDRAPALVAAHKKFLVSRLADGCLVVCLALVHHDVGSLNLDRITAWVSARASLTPTMHVAAVLAVIAVALRSAQLPFHGWLIQVMEAPTPVSALLHAGIVNIGGFVLLRLAPWLERAAFAQLLLVVIGLVSAVLAALVMTTRISVKVALAWSTCAQLGFMLVQCGLGLWHLALLHLVAHSLYKAHAFLSAGNAVEDWKMHAQRPALPVLSPSRFALVALVVSGCAVGSVAFFPHLHEPSPSDRIGPLVLAVIVGLSLSPMLVCAAGGLRAMATMALRCLGIALLYVGWHVIAAQLMPARGASTSTAGWVLVGLGFTALFVVQTAIRLRPAGRLARAVYPWLFSGFYLDERFTRLTFRLWPPRRKQDSASHHTIHERETIEAQA
jgi:NAD(P)H-quinone oxidoreductase subunit 5